MVGILPTLSRRKTERAFTQSYFSSIVDLYNLGGKLTHHVMKIIVFVYEAHHDYVVPDLDLTLAIFCFYPHLLWTGVA
jgi:hypothetical protein